METSLTRGDDERRVFELHGKCAGSQTLQTQVMRQFTQESTESVFEKGQIRCVLIEGGLMAQTLGLAAGHDRIVINARVCYIF